MSQCILITAYKNQEALKELVDFLKDDFYIYIHIDKKSSAISNDFIHNLNESQNVTVIKKYKINWGGSGHVKAILHMMHMAIKETDASFFHVITGEDYPLISSEDLYKKFDGETKLFMTCEKLVTLDQPVIDRFSRIAFPDLFNFLSRNRFKMIATYYTTLIANKLLPERKSMLGYFIQDIWKGLVYVSIPRSAVEYVLDFVNDNARGYRKLKYISVSEEFFFQTILYNSCFKDLIVDDDLRYCDWNRRYGSNPAYLDISDIDKVFNGRDIFARKIGEGPGEELKKAINSKIVRK